MTIKGLIAVLSQQEDLNFLLTNRVPRAALTRFMGWFSKIEQPLIRDLSIALLAAVFRSRPVRGAQDEFQEPARLFHPRAQARLAPARPRPVDRGQSLRRHHRRVRRDRRYRTVSDQGRRLFASDLLGDPALVEAHRNGRFITLRLTSSMYHRFHAPYDCRIEQVDFISGDTWNVNPIALKRIEKLFCKNERAVIRTRLPTGETLTLVPVAAILVASIRLHFLDLVLNAETRGPDVFPCDVSVRKGDELGWFEHGSTIIVLAPDHFEFCDNVVGSARICAGQPLMRKPAVRGSDRTNGCRPDGPMRALSTALKLTSRVRNCRICHLKSSGSFGSADRLLFATVSVAAIQPRRNWDEQQGS